MSFDRTSESSSLRSSTIHHRASAPRSRRRWRAIPPTLVPASSSPPCSTPERTSRGWPVSMPRHASPTACHPTTCGGFLDDPSPGVRAAAIRALAIRPDEATVVPTAMLVDALDDDAYLVRISAASSALAGRADARAALIDALDMGSERAQDAALLALTGRAGEVQADLLSWASVQIERAEALHRAHGSLAALPAADPRRRLPRGRGRPARSTRRGPGDRRRRRRRCAGSRRTHAPIAALERSGRPGSGHRGTGFAR